LYTVPGPALDKLARREMEEARDHAREWLKGIW
jgi:hypothetical protein